LTFYFYLVAPKPLLGNILVIIAQLFLAGMFVYEEKILKSYNVKIMEIVGWEGVWGCLITIVFIYVFYTLPGDDFGSAENPFQAIMQIKNSQELLFSTLCSSLVIGPFNYFGTSLTKEASAMHRCLVDASRMCIVWMVSMCCSWESFKGNQAFGYGLILLGNLLYYELILKTDYSFLLENNIENKQKKRSSSEFERICSLKDQESTKYEFMSKQEDSELNDSNILVLDNHK